MKTTMTSLLFLVSAAGLFGEYCPHPVRSIDLATLESIMERMSRGDVLEFSKGDKLPLQVYADGDILGVEKSKMWLDVLTTFYVKPGEGELLFSLDREEWHSLLEFFTGECRVKLLPSSTGVNMTAGAVMKIRK